MTETYITAINWACVVLSLAALPFNIRKSVVCWYLWLIADTGLVITSIAAGDLPQSMLFGVYVIAAGYGLWAWRKDGGTKQ